MRIFLRAALLALLLFIQNTASVFAVTPTAINAHDAIAVEARVREYFADAPVMIEIARCESKFRQYTDSGAPLRGGAGGGMIGVFQFYEAVHSGAAKGLGYDLATLEGNVAYARHVYTAQGTTPWNSAKYCWGNAVASTTVALPVAVATPTATANRAALLKQIELLTQLIALLQKQLALQLAVRS